MLEWPLLVLMGLLAGAYGALVGAGGGFIIGPLFLIFFGMEPGLAVGTTLCLVFINSSFGTLAYARQGRIDFRSGGTFGLAAMPGSVIGALALSAAPGDAFRVAFGALLLLIAPVMIFRPPLGDRGGRGLGKSGLLRAVRRVETAEGRVYEYGFNNAGAIALNVVLGFLSSFFGVGGGFLRTPALVYAFNFPVAVATATSILALSLYTAVGSATHVALGNVSLFPHLVFAGMGMAAGSQAGASLSKRLSGPWILRILALALAALGAQLVLEGVRG